MKALRPAPAYLVSGPLPGSAAAMRLLAVARIFVGSGIARLPAHAAHRPRARSSGRPSPHSGIAARLVASAPPSGAGLLSRGRARIPGVSVIASAGAGR